MAHGPHCRVLVQPSRKSRAGYGTYGMHAFLIAGGLYSIPALRKTWGEETVYTRYQERFEHPVALLSEHDGVGR